MVAPGKKLLLGVVVLACGIRTIAAESELVWHWSHPSPHGNNIADLIHRSGLYIHVTDHGGIYTSSNRFVWVQRESGTSADLRAAAFLGDRLLVTGERGLVLWSDDAVRFEVASVVPPTTDWFEGVASSPTVAVAVGDRGAIYRSVDGQEWLRVLDAPFTHWLSSIAWGANGFVTVGEQGFIARSIDGIQWHEQTSGIAEDLWRVVFAEGEFITVGSGGTVLVSTNGSAWAPTLLGTGVQTALYAAARAPDSRLTGGQSALLLQLRGAPTEPWKSQFADINTPLPAPSWTYTTALWDGQRYLAAGRTGVIIESLHSDEPRAENLAFWFRNDESPRNWIWAAERLGSTYMAVGDRATILSSSSGSQWIQEFAATTNEPTLFGLGGSPEVAVAVGSNGTLLCSVNERLPITVTNFIVIEGHTNRVVITNNLDLLGIEWIDLTSPALTNTLQGVGWDGSHFVVVGSDGIVLRSANGTNWNRGNIGASAFFSSVTPSPHGWVATGSSGNIFTSPDAVTWADHSLPTTNWVYRARAFEEGLVAVGQNGLVLISTNAVEWVPEVSDTEAWLTDIRKVGATFFICGTQATVLRSTNLTSWERMDIPTGKSLYAMAADQGQLIVAGVEGIILRNLADPAISPVRITAYRHFREVSPPTDAFLFEGLPEQMFRLEIASSLEAWLADGNLELDSEGSLLFQREAAAENGFYRTAVGP
jgi:hypothetical protein